MERLDIARSEMQLAYDYDFILVNDDVDEAVRQLHEFLVESPCASFDDCIRWAARLFRKNYYTEILQLIHQFPVASRRAREA